MPKKSKLPGASNTAITLTASCYSFAFHDKFGQQRKIYIEAQWAGEDPFMSLQCGQSVCSFRPRPEDSSCWSASGLTVDAPDQRCGIAKAFYACAKRVLESMDLSVAPSNDLFPDGAALWRTLDPSIELEEKPDMPGYYRPK